MATKLFRLVCVQLFHMGINPNQPTPIWRMCNVTRLTSLKTIASQKSLTKSFGLIWLYKFPATWYPVKLKHISDISVHFKNENGTEHYRKKKIMYNWLQFILLFKTLTLIAILNTILFIIMKTSAKRNTQMWIKFK